MSDYVEILPLPQHHCWFEADTSLPSKRANVAKLGLGLDVFMQVVARIQGVYSDAVARHEDNVLDSALRTYDRYLMSSAQMTRLRHSIAPPWGRR